MAPLLSVRIGRVRPGLGPWGREGRSEVAPAAYARGGSHAFLRCTRQLCTLEERA